MAMKNRVKRPTSIDVARLAGVSQSTVSNVINNRTDVPISDETRKRVQRAIAQLDYQPHEAARNLRIQSSHILGMTIPEMYNMHYMEMVNGASQYSQQENYSIFLSVTNFAIRQEQQCIAWLKQLRYDALILTSAPGNAFYDELHAALRQGYAITALGFQDPLMDSVTVTEMEGEKQVFAHLVELRHQRIGYIYGVVDHTLLNGRLEHCVAIQRSLGLSVEEAWIRRCGPDLEDGYQATRDLLSTLSRDAWPTALIVVNDFLAIGVLAALHDAGLVVPRDISVISFDDVPLAARTIPALTTVAANARVMGEAAARLTIGRLNNPSRPAEHIRIQPELIIRASTQRISQDVGK